MDEFLEFYFSLLEKKTKTLMLYYIIVLILFSLFIVAFYNDIVLDLF